MDPLLFHHIVEVEKLYIFNGKTKTSFLNKAFAPIFAQIGLIIAAVLLGLRIKYKFNYHKLLLFEPNRLF